MWMIATTLAVSIPIAAFIVQSALWPALQPFVWFLFYPAVFLGSWIGGPPRSPSRCRARIACARHVMAVRDSRSRSPSGRTSSSPT